MRKIYSASISYLFTGISILLTTFSSLSAWKVNTHAHLAFIAQADAIDDGSVTIYLADYDNGRLVLDAAGKPVEIGRMKLTCVSSESSAICRVISAPESSAQTSCPTF